MKKLLAIPLFFPLLLLIVVWGIVDLIEKTYATYRIAKTKI